MYLNDLLREKREDILRLAKNMVHIMCVSSALLHEENLMRRAI